METPDKNVLLSHNQFALVLCTQLRSSIYAHEWFPAGMMHILIDTDEIDVSQLFAYNPTTVEGHRPR